MSDADRPPIEVGWDFTDLRPHVDGTFEPREPIHLTRTDGVSLLYPGLTHTVYGESESGKSLILQAECAQRIRAGDDVLFIDYESDARAVVRRLLDFGATAEEIVAHFHYIEHPDTPPGAGLALGTWQTEILARPYAVAVIDGVTACLATFRLSSDSADDVAKWQVALPNPIAERTGAAVVSIDHVSKDKEGRGRFPLGSQQKLSGVQGAAYLVAPKKLLGRGKVGELALTLTKDREGFVRGLAEADRINDRTQEVARIVLDDTGPLTVVTVQPPAGVSVDEAGHTVTEEWRPTYLMERASRFLESSDTPVSRNTVLAGFAGKKPAKVQALDRLVLEGYVERVAQGRTHLHRSLRPFREADDPKPQGPSGSPVGPEWVPGPSSGDGSPGSPGVSIPGTQGPTPAGQCSQHGFGYLPSKCDECRDLSDARAAS